MPQWHADHDDVRLALLAALDVSRRSFFMSPSLGKLTAPCGLLGARGVVVGLPRSGAMPPCRDRLAAGRKTEQ